MFPCADFCPNLHCSESSLESLNSSICNNEHWLASQQPARQAIPALHPAPAGLVQCKRGLTVGSPFPAVFHWTQRVILAHCSRVRSIVPDISTEARHPVVATRTTGRPCAKPYRSRRDAHHAPFRLVSIPSLEILRPRGPSRRRESGASLRPFSPTSCRSSALSDMTVPPPGPSNGAVVPPGVPQNSRAQLSIRSFFQPKDQQATYASPPAPAAAQAPHAPTPPPLPRPTATTTQARQLAASGRLGAPMAVGSAVGYVPTAPMTTATTTEPPRHAGGAAAASGGPPGTSSPPRADPALPPQATVSPVRPAHVAALRRINALLLPVAYPDSFYDRALDPAASALFSRVVLWSGGDEATRTRRTTAAAAAEREDGASEGDGEAGGVVVGGIVAHAEEDPFGRFPQRSGGGPTPPSSAAAVGAGVNALYIQSLCLLAPYRSLGLAAAMLEEVLAVASRLPKELGVGFVYAHVWTENHDGLRWYLARGFARDPEPVKGYYFKLKPDSAWIVRRPIVRFGEAAPSSNVAAAATSHATPTAPRGTSVTATAANLPPIAPRPTGPSSAPHAPPPRPPPPPTGQSYQKARPDTEWNDLPADMVAPSASSSSSNLLLPVPGRVGTTATAGSGASSRSSSSTRKKRDRTYPAAAFGN